MDNNINLERCPHGQVLQAKAFKTNDSKLLEAWDAYLNFRSQIPEISNDKDIIAYVKLFNNYRNVSLKIFEERSNSGQETLRSSLLEEFFVHLLSNLIHKTCEDQPNSLYVGRGNSYVDLTFSPKNFKDFLTSPNPNFHSKDQDFIIGSELQVVVKPSSKDASEIKNDIVVPVLAVECKTYIERNMLDSCAGTAARLKKAMPYCLYFVAAEYMKMDKANPELTDIDEVFIFCKATNSEREKNRKNNLNPHPIHEDLVIDFYNIVKRHFNSIWWQPEEILRTGKVINRP